jgi:hypothetical protein
MWICSCGRKNDNEDLKCAFCREDKPDKVKGEPRVKSSRCSYNGRWYQSKKEMDYAKELDFRKKAGEIVEIRPQYRIQIEVNGVFICSYFVDFRVTLKDGTIQYHEVKGFFTELFRLKWKLCMALKEEIDPGSEWIVIK